MPAEHSPAQPPADTPAQGQSHDPRTGELRLALRVLMMPRDTNHQGTIFGGIMLAHIDQAGYIEARRHGLHRWVTASIDRVDFHAPVFVGEVVEFKARTVRRGRTSVTVEVVVDSERLDGAWARVTEATLTMVAVDEHGKSIPFGASRPVVPA